MRTLIIAIVALLLGTGGGTFFQQQQTAEASRSAETLQEQLQQLEASSEAAARESRQELDTQALEISTLQDRIIELADEKAGEQDRAERLDGQNEQLERANDNIRDIAEAALNAVRLMNVCLQGQQEWQDILQNALQGVRYEQNQLQETAAAIDADCLAAQASTRVLESAIQAAG